MIPVITQPISGVIRNRWVTVSGSMSLSCEAGRGGARRGKGGLGGLGGGGGGGFRRYDDDHGRTDGLTGTFLCVMITHVSLPLTAIDVIPAPVMALNAYSVGEGKGGQMYVG